MHPSNFDPSKDLSENSDSLDSDKGNSPPLKTKFSGTSGIPQLNFQPKTKFSNQPGLPPTLQFRNVNPLHKAPTMAPMRPKNELQLPSNLQKSRESHKGSNFFTLMAMPQNGVMSLNPFTSKEEKKTAASPTHEKKHSHRRRVRKSDKTGKEAYKSHSGTKKEHNSSRGSEKKMPHSSLIMSLNPFMNDDDDVNPLAFSIINPAANPVILFYTILEIPEDMKEELSKLNTAKFLDPDEFKVEKKDDSKDEKLYPYAASFNQLILFLTSPDAANIEYQKIFLITFPSFATTSKVLAAIFTRFFAEVKDDNPESNIRDRSQLKQVRDRIIRILSTWLKIAPYQFTDDMVHAIDEFIKYLNADPSFDLQAKILTNAVVQFKEAQSKKSAQNEIQKVTQSSKSILDISTKDLAEQVTLLYISIYKNIGPTELLTTIWGQKKGGGSKNVDKLTQHFDKFSRYVQLTIIQGNDAKTRAKIFQQWVETAIAFKGMNNYHGVFAVICGLMHRSVQRLKDTLKIAMKSMSRSMKKSYEELIELCDLKNDFHNYRPVIRTAVEPCIPFIGCLQRDIIYVQEDYQNMIDGLINFQKCIACVSLIGKVEKFQNGLYNFTYNEEIQYLISESSFPELPDTAGMMKLSIEKEKKK